MTSDLMQSQSITHYVYDYGTFLWISYTAEINDTTKSRLYNENTANVKFQSH